MDMNPYPRSQDQDPVKGRWGPNLLDDREQGKNELGIGLKLGPRLKDLQQIC